MRSDSDHWGWRARFGILVIDKDPVAEVELWAMAPPGVTVHTARFESPRKPGTDVYDDAARTVAESADIARGLNFLGRMRLDAICVCFVTSSFFGGAKFDEYFTAQASQQAHGTPVTTAPLAITTAMRHTGIRRPYIMIPPWFKDEIAGVARRYFTDAGYDIAGLSRFDPGIGWRNMQPWEIWDNGGQWAVRPEEIYHQIRQSVPANADGIVIAGSGFRCLETIELLEADLSLPVITSNQSSMWHCLRIARLAASVPGCGRLLTDLLK